ncbi:hypothetical protein PthstB1num2_19260 [Parageobacillus thermoglucosidasius]|nr:hypothetical protein PthstB1num2_19260 [Parageobacillus thermoglucosidasius]
MAKEQTTTATEIAGFAVGIARTGKRMIGNIQPVA